MPEYIVDCEHVPYGGDGRTLVLPISVNGHVHERLIRCRDCYHAGRVHPHYCRIWGNELHGLDGFCHRAVPRDEP